MSFNTNTRRKKSKASSDQPRKLAATTCFCSLVHPDNAAGIIISGSTIQQTLSGSNEEEIGALIAVAGLPATKAMALMPDPEQSSTRETG
jgi:hypothetical protein